MTGPEPISGDVAGLLDGTAVVCRQWAEQLEGPYRRGAQPLRRDLVEDREGTPLWLGLRLVDAAGLPVTDGEIEVWHCDALGHYSGYPPAVVDRPSTAAEGASPGSIYEPDQTFLRGRQLTDDSGAVEFVTIFPGWYPGRTVHIHVMAHTPQRTHTSQLYFPESLIDAVFEHAPYNERLDRDTTNSSDEIFPTGGDPAVLELRPRQDGYIAAARLHLPAT